MLLLSSSQKFPPLRPLSGHPHNLPPQSTPFVGRESELRAIAAQLAAPACRLLTLVGPGGIGKTRLALQAAAAQIENFPQGVYFVPLAALSSGEFLVAAIAEALHFSFYQRDTPQAQLYDYLREKHLLLVLDNFEHVMDGAGLTTELLIHAPYLKILATSRERLNVRGELTLTMTGMDFPDEAATEVEAYPAVQLFLQYARRVRPAFVLDAEQRPWVARLCAQVEGMPLALELAASWLRTLSCQEIAEELTYSSDFLSSARRDAPERHRSLRAVFEYSWQLLSEAEQRAVQALAVFRGDFHREAALVILSEIEAVSRPLTELALLTALVDKSLVQHHANGAYGMHTLLREYAREKLQAVPALEAQVQQQHSAYFAEFLQRQRPALEGGAAQPAALMEIAAALEDVRAAWQWATRQGQVALLERGLHGLARFFNVSGRAQEGVSLFAETLGALGSLASVEIETTRAWLLVYLTNLAVSTGAYTRAQQWLPDALSLSRRLELAPALARGLVVQGRLAWIQGDYETAREQYLQALEIYTAEADLGGQAKVFDSLGSLAWAIGDYAAARRNYERGQLLYQQLGNLYGNALTLDHLGVVARDTGDLAAARQYFEQSYRQLQTLEAPIPLAYAANHLGGVLAETGALEAAVPYFQQCIAIGEELGERRIIAYTRYDWGVLLMAARRFAEALSLLQESATVFQSLGDQFGLILTWLALGDMALRTDDVETARQHYLTAIRAADAIQNYRLLAQALVNWAQYQAARAEWTAAAETLGFVQTLSDQKSELDAFREDLLAQVRIQLSAAALTAALARGQAAKLAEICAGF